MSTIPTLIVAPAILAAGIAYKYTGGDAGEHRLRMRRHSDVVPSTESSSVGGGIGVRRAPGAQKQQHANEFIPTTMIGGNMQRYNSLGGNSLASQTGDSNFHPSYKGDRKEFESYKPQGIRDTETKRMWGPYPRTDKEQKDSSWFHRASHEVAGDLGPIEHQDAVLAKQERMAEQAGVRYPDEADIRRGADPHPKSIPSNEQYSGRRASWTGGDTSAATNRNVGSTMHQVADQGAAVADHAKEAAKESRNWFWNKTKDAEDTVRDVGDSASSWLWGSRKKADQDTGNIADRAHQAVGTAQDTVRDAGESAGSWFQGTKDQAANRVHQAADHVHQAADTAQDTVRDAGNTDSGGSWFQGTKDQAADRVHQAADTAQDTVRDAGNTDSRGSWFQGTKDQAADRVHQAADTAQDTVRDAGNTDSRGSWFWGSNKKKEQASDESGSDWLRSKKLTVDEHTQQAMDDAKQAAENTRSRVGAVKDTAQDWIHGTKENVEDAARGTGQAVSDAGGWVQDKTQQAGHGISDAAGATQDWLSRKKQGAQETANNAIQGTKQSIDSAQSKVDDTADAAQDWLSTKKYNVQDSSANNARQNTNNESRGWWFWKKSKQPSVKDNNNKSGGWFGNKGQQAEDRVDQAAQETRSWLGAKKEHAEDAVADGVKEAGNWLSGRTDDLGRNVESAKNTAEHAKDKSRSWLWGQGSKAEQAIADTASTVGLKAGDASARAQDRANALGHAANNQTQDKSGRDTRRDSLMSMDKDTSVMGVLDNKFDEARAALRSTGRDLRAMAENASQPTNEGLIEVGGKEIRSVGGIGGTSANEQANRAVHGDNIKLRLVEVDSGIPVLVGNIDR
ncbi:hypothetical protein GGF46_000334 [Coemansia sp. RSA 552]|nr:hypothetical protein GGF46_000334 [Coemansia sp. RSA 552]